jgi:hypothetical protein
MISNIYTALFLRTNLRAVANCSQSILNLAELGRSNKSISSMEDGGSMYNLYIISEKYLLLLFIKPQAAGHHHLTRASNSFKFYGNFFSTIKKHIFIYTTEWKIAER